MKLQTIKHTVRTIERTIKTMQPDSWRTQGMSAADRGYGHKWREAREGYLRKHPLCVYCKREGKLTAATVVDHSIRHCGNQDIFWDKSKWQSLCKSCHSSVKAIEEGRGGQNHL